MILSNGIAEADATSNVCFTFSRWLYLHEWIMEKATWDTTVVPAKSTRSVPQQKHGTQRATEEGRSDPRLHGVCRDRNTAFL